MDFEKEGKQMSNAFDRRQFLKCGVAVSAISLVPVNPVIASSVNDEWSVFKRLGGIFVEIQNSLNPIADGITKTKFLRFLHGVNRPLMEILGKKRVVLNTLNPSSCGSDGTDELRDARRAAAGIIPIVKILSERALTLSEAVGPSGSKQAATSIAESLSSLESRKMWVDRIQAYCFRSDAFRRGFMNEVQTSIGIVKDTQSKLASLIDTIEKS